jgi:hypothetical protein
MARGTSVNTLLQGFIFIAELANVPLTYHPGTHTLQALSTKGGPVRFGNGLLRNGTVLSLSL